MQKPCKWHVYYFILVIIAFEQTFFHLQCYCHTRYKIHMCGWYVHFACRASGQPASTQFINVEFCQCFTHQHIYTTGALLCCAACPEQAIYFSGLCGKSVRRRVLYMCAGWYGEGPFWCLHFFYFFLSFEFSLYRYIFNYCLCVVGAVDFFSAHALAYSKTFLLICTSTSLLLVFLSFSLWWLYSIHWCKLRTKLFDWITVFTLTVRHFSH